MLYPRAMAVIAIDFSFFKIRIFKGLFNLLHGSISKGVIVNLLGIFSDYA